MDVSWAIKVLLDSNVALLLQTIKASHLILKSIYSLTSVGLEAGKSALDNTVHAGSSEPRLRKYLVISISLKMNA